MASTRPPLTTRDELQIPHAPTKEKGVLGWLQEFLSALKSSFRLHAHLFPAVISGELRGNTYTEATKPSASLAGTAAVILSSDAATKPQMSDGTIWIPLGGGGGGAPASASFITIVNEAALSNERALAVTAPITLSDGGADAAVTLGFTFDTPTINFGTAYAAGVATSGIRSDATLKYPTSLMSAASLALLTATDNAIDLKLTNFLGALYIDPNTGLNIQPTGTSSLVAVVTVTIDPSRSYLYGLRSAFVSADITGRVGAWDAKVGGVTAKLTGATIVGYDSSQFAVTPPATSSGTNNLYFIGMANAPLINNANALWGDAATALFKGVRRLFATPTIATQAAVIIEPPTAAISDQIGLLIRQQTAQATAANRSGFDVLEQNSGTNRYAGRCYNRLLVSNPSGRAETALELRQLNTGATAGAHVNLDDKAGDPPAPVTGDLWRNGAALNYRKDGATTVDLAGAAGGGITSTELFLDFGTREVAFA